MKVRASWAIVVWLVVWQLGSMALGSDLLLPGPFTVLMRTGELAPQPAFWARVGFSLARILAGFVLGAALGMVGAAAAARWRVAEELLAPPMALAKSVPVASITVLALIWLRAANLAILVVLLVVLPVVYENTLQGLRATDPRLNEVARLLHLRPLRRLRFFVMPALTPYLRAALVLSLGTAWKAGVAAEVIGIPAGSLGEAIYDAKIYFDTPALFAVTLAVVLASALCTAVLKAALSGIEPAVCGSAGHAARCEQTPHDAREASHSSPASGICREDTGRDDPGFALHIVDVSKSFGDAAVLRQVAFTARSAEPICIMAPSGTGKTTLLRIIAGLEAADAGSLFASDACGRRLSPSVSMMFQENRLAEQASALANVRLALTSGSDAWNEAPALLDALGLGDRLLAPARACSGGERRRTALARALLVPHDILLLDEPFTGLDDHARATAARLVLQREEGNIVIVATHSAHDAEMLGARIIRL